MVSAKDENIPIRKTENKIKSFGILSGNKNNRIGQKRQMPYTVINNTLISGLQNFEQYQKLNPIDIEINDSQIISSLSKYRNHRFRLQVTSLSLSALFDQTTNVIFIACGCLDDAKKALINGKIHNILRVINLAEIPMFDLIKRQSKWINAVFSEDNRDAAHFSFDFISNSLQDILNFSFSMLDGKRNLITFPTSEQKVPILSFTIQVIR